LIALSKHAAHWFALYRFLVQTIAAVCEFNLRALESMATDYDAPRKTEDDAESIEALKERVPAKGGSSIDAEDADNPGFELAGADLSDVELDVVVLPQQDDEFTCVNCFLVRHRSQLDHETKLGPALKSIAFQCILRRCYCTGNAGL